MSTQVSFMITKAQRADLAALGYTEDQIREMTPAEAHEILMGSQLSENEERRAKGREKHAKYRTGLSDAMRRNLAEAGFGEEAIAGMSRSDARDLLGTDTLGRINTRPGKSAGELSAEQQQRLRTLGVGELTIQSFTPGVAEMVELRLADKSANRKDTWVNTVELGAALGTAPTRISAWASECPDFPEALAINGSRKLYSLEECQAWVQRRRETGKGRRFRSEMRSLSQEIFDIVAAQRPMTVRQGYYQAVVRKLVYKTDDGYWLVQRLIRDMRMAEYGQSRIRDEQLPAMPLDWIVDNSRSTIEWRSFINPNEALDWTSRIYRRDRWQDRDERIYLWVEKDALAGAIASVTQAYDVPVLIAKGCNSISYIARFAERLKRHGQPSIIHYFRDLDPTGVTAPAAMEETLRAIAPDADFIIETHAITLDQVKEHGLEGTWQETKVKSNFHFPAFEKKYGKEMRARGLVDSKGNPASFELDALPPNVLRSLVRQCLDQHVDSRIWGKDWTLETHDREVLKQLAGKPSLLDQGVEEQAAPREPGLDDMLPL